MSQDEELADLNGTTEGRRKKKRGRGRKKVKKESEDEAKKVSSDTSELHEKVRVM